MFAFSTQSLIDFDICVATDTLSLALLPFDSLLVSRSGVDFSWVDSC